MKIIREKSRVYKGKEYFKYKINIPEVVLKRAQLTAGDVLSVKVEKDAILLKKLAQSSP